MPSPIVGRAIIRHMPSILRIEAAAFPQQLAGGRVVAGQMIGAPRDDHVLAIDLARPAASCKPGPIRARVSYFRGCLPQRLRRSTRSSATRYDSPSCITATIARSPASTGDVPRSHHSVSLPYWSCRFDLPLLVAAKIEARQRAALVVHDDVLAIGHRRRIAAAAVRDACPRAPRRTFCRHSSLPFMS